MKNVCNYDDNKKLNDQTTFGAKLYWDHNPIPKHVGYNCDGWNAQFEVKIRGHKMYDWDMFDRENYWEYSNCFQPWPFWSRAYL